jgi:hypothetical protein
MQHDPQGAARCLNIAECCSIGCLYYATIFVNLSMISSRPMSCVIVSLILSMLISDCYELRCGSSVVGACTESAYCALLNESHEVSCCADSAVVGFAQKYPTTCSDVWGERDANGAECQHELDYVGAVNFCTSIGGRMCTANEIQRDCTKGTGCAHDFDLVWTSTPYGLSDPCCHNYT